MTDLRAGTLVAWFFVSLMPQERIGGGAPLVLSCQSTFPTDASVNTLAERFGEANVQSASLYLGEGNYEPGTVLFADVPEQRAEVLWKDVEAKRSPRVVRVRGNKSRWRSPDRLTLGVTLHAVEAINRKPFRLTGFAWDYGGTTISWSGGALEHPGDPCKLWARLDVKGSQNPKGPYGQVMGDRDFSSGHPAMQVLNPVVAEIGLAFR